MRVPVPESCHNMPEDEDIRARLARRVAELDAEDRAGAEGQAVVALDQTSVGRLSRMDALQRQAMAQATARRRAAERARVEAALRRLDEGEYGFCAVCGDEIAPARLEADPAAPLCAACMRGG